MAAWEPTRRQVLYGAAALVACGTTSKESPNAGGADAGLPEPDAGLPDADLADAGAPDAAAPEPEPSDDRNRFPARRRWTDGNVQRSQDDGTTRWVAGDGNYVLIHGGNLITIESAYGDGGAFEAGLGPALEHDVRRMFGEVVLLDLRDVLAAAA